MNTSNIPTTQLKIVEADGIKIFYREAGPADGPVLLLLHGYPTSSHMFRHPFFIPPGAEAYRRDIPSAKVVFYDTGHFALETHVEEISDQIGSFLTGLVQGGKF